MKIDIDINELVNELVIRTDTNNHELMKSDGIWSNTILDILTERYNIEDEIETCLKQRSAKMKRKILDLYNNELTFFYAFREAKKANDNTFNYDGQRYMVDFVQHIIDN